MSISIKLVYALPDRLWEVMLTLPANSTAQQALEQSGFRRAFPDYPLDPPVLGIFGRRCEPTELLRDHDRVEIYRPLQFDPMESRRRRAAHKKAARHKPAFRPRRASETKQS